MKFISSASKNSQYRGYNYYKDGKIKNIKKINENEYMANAIGNDNNIYNVSINVLHPKKDSHCSCPHAEDNKVVCKHKVALFFSVFPNYGKEYIDEIERQEKEYEEYQEELYNSMYNIVKNMKKNELQTALIGLLEESDEWVIDRFIIEYEK